MSVSHVFFFKFSSGLSFCTRWSLVNVRFCFCRFFCVLLGLQNFGQYFLSFLSFFSKKSKNWELFTFENHRLKLFFFFCFFLFALWEIKVCLKIFLKKLYIRNCEATWTKKIKWWTKKIKENQIRLINSKSSVPSSSFLCLCFWWWN